MEKDNLLRIAKSHLEQLKISSKQSPDEDSWKELIEKWEAIIERIENELEE